MEYRTTQMPKKRKLYTIINDLIKITDRQLSMLENYKTASPSLVIDYYIATTESFIENVKEVKAHGQFFRNKKYAGYNLRTMLEELGSIAYFISLSDEEKKKFIADNLLEACRNLYTVSDSSGKDLYKKDYAKFNAYNRPDIDHVNRRQLVISVRDRLKVIQGNDALYNTYGLLCWMPHSNFFYLSQQKQLERHERTLLEAIAFFMFFVHYIDLVCAGATRSQIDAVKVKHQSIVDAYISEVNEVYSL